MNDLDRPYAAVTYLVDVLGREWVRPDPRIPVFSCASDRRLEPLSVPELREQAGPLYVLAGQ